MNTITDAVLATGMHEHGWHGGPWFLLIPLLWIAVIATFAFVFKRRRRFWHDQHHGAEAVLRERYARGEVDEEEFRNRLETLRGK
ncbi:MAG: SHOCT domain-containing protein [Stackebrandtia sp.]